MQRLPAPQGVRAALVVGGILLLLAGYAILSRIAYLFQNLYATMLLVLPGAHLSRDYWAAVRYGVGMAVLVGFLLALVAVVAALEVVHHLQEHRGWPSGRP
jgi:hypothetical protein